MATDYSGYNSGNGFAGFNYNNEQDKLKRKQLMVQQLQQLALQQQPQSYVQSSMGTFNSSPNGAASALSKIAAAFLSNKQQDDLNDSQKGLDKTSQDALINSMDPNAQPYVQKARDAQTASEAAAELNRESRRGTNDSGTVDTSSPDSPDVQSFPVRSGDASVTTGPETPVQSISPVAKAAAAQLAPKPSLPPQAAMAAAQLQGEPITDPMSGVVIGTGAPPEPPQTGSSSGSWGPPTPQAAPPAPPMAPPQAMPPQQGGMPPPQAMPPQPQPMPAPQQSGPIGDPRSMVDQAAANAQPTQADQMHQIVQMANSGPLGMQMAQSQLQALFGSKNGRYKTTVLADPVNGGFVKVNEDSATGRSSVERIDMGTGTKVLETKETPNGIMERTAAGWRQAKDTSGAPLVGKEQADHEMKIGSAVVANKSAQSAIDSSLSRLDRIQELSHQVMVGPIEGHLPNYTAARQELHALMSQDVFAETKDAVSAAADSGGAPRMAQSEFKYMANNGGLSMNMDATTIDNLIAQQKIRLNALKQSLGQFGQTLQQNGQAPQQTLPPRGQTFNGPNAAAASRLGLGG